MMFISVRLYTQKIAAWSSRFENFKPNNIINIYCLKMVVILILREQAASLFTDSQDTLCANRDAMI
jgi:hypothetical protein